MLFFYAFTRVELKKILHGLYFSREYCYFCASFTAKGQPYNKSFNFKV